MPGQPFTLEPGVERRLATRLFNRVWELLERTDRTRDEDDEMITWQAGTITRSRSELSGMISWFCCWLCPCWVCCCWDWPRRS